MGDRRQALEAIHARIVAGDPVASRDLFNLVYRPLWRILTGAYGARGLSEEQAIDSATDALIDYIRNSTKFQSHKASLFTYLAVAAKRDALNRLRDQGVYEKYLENYVELGALAGNIGSDEAVAMRLDAESILRKHGRQLVESETDISVLKLMLMGESETDVYAVAIGAESLPATARKAAVKKYRDMMEKRLRRLGEYL